MLNANVFLKEYSIIILEALFNENLNPPPSVILNYMMLFHYQLLFDVDI